MKLTDLISGESYVTADKIENIDIQNVTTNTSYIEKNTLFVIIQGINFDTGKIINDIIKKHPSAIICDKDWGIKTDIPIITVDNARRTLSNVCSALAKIDYSKLKIIGVTGTNGKTTTATMIQRILSYSGIKTGFIGTGKIKINETQINDDFYSMTTPDPEFLYPLIKKMQNEGCSAIVMEVSSHALALGKVAPIKFEYAIFTNLSSEHMDFHATIEEYYNAKCSLFKQSKKGLFNADDEYSAKAMIDLFDICNTTSIGVLWPAEATARDIIFDGFNGSTYIYKEDSLLFKASVPLPGHYNVYNSLMALKCAIDLGVRPCIAKEALKELGIIDGRFEIINDDITVIIDYAHTDEAMSNILKTINSLKNHRQKIITVFGCGGDRDKTKRAAMGKTAEKLSDFLIITNDNSRTENESEIIADITSGLTYPHKREIIPQREEAITRAILYADDGDIIVILGKGHEHYIINQSGYHYFNEKSIVSNALSARKSEAVHS